MTGSLKKKKKEEEKKRGGGCSVIRACSLIRSNKVVKGSADITARLSYNIAVTILIEKFHTGYSSALLEANVVSLQRF